MPYNIIKDKSGDDMERNEFGKNLAALRKQKGLTQAELAEKLHFTFQSVSNWERGVSSPDLETLTRLGGFFGVSTDELLLRERRQIRERPPARRAARAKYSLYPTGSALAFKITLPVTAGIFALEFALLLSSRTPAAALAALIFAVIYALIFLADAILLFVSKKFDARSPAAKAFFALLAANCALALVGEFLKNAAALLVTALLLLPINIAAHILVWFVFPNRADGENKGAAKSYAVAAVVLAATFIADFFLESLLLTLAEVLCELLLLFFLQSGKQDKMVGGYYAPSATEKADRNGKNVPQAIPEEYRASAFRPAQGSSGVSAAEQYAYRPRKEHAYSRPLIHPRIPLIVSAAAVLSVLLLTVLWHGKRSYVAALLTFGCWALAPFAAFTVFFIAKKGSGRLWLDMLFFVALTAAAVSGFLITAYSYRTSVLLLPTSVPRWFIALTLALFCACVCYAAFAFRNGTNLSRAGNAVLNACAAAAAVGYSAFMYFAYILPTENPCEYAMPVFFLFDILLSATAFFLQFAKADRMRAAKTKPARK